MNVSYLPSRRNLKTARDIEVLSYQKQVTFIRINLFTPNICDNVFKYGSSEICGRQPLKKFIWSTLEYFVPYTHIVTLHRKRLSDLIIWKMHGFSYQFSIARENATRTWNIGTYTFPKVWLLFFPSNSHLIQTKFDINSMQ